MSESTIDIIDKNLDYIKKVEKDTPEENKKFIKNVRMGTECVKSAYVLIDVAKNVIDYMSTLRKIK